jgi:hypothetical protein
MKISQRRKSIFMENIERLYIKSKMQRYRIRMSVYLWVPILFQQYTSIAPALKGKVLKSSTKVKVCQSLMTGLLIFCPKN